MITTIVIADDHELVRSSYAALLANEADFKIVGERSNGRDLVALVERTRPDVAIVDIVMPELNGIDAIKHIEAVSPLTRVIVISNYTDAAYVRGALAAGAAGYISKGGAVHDLIQAIRNGRRGNVYLSEDVRDAAKPDGRGKANVAGQPLSPREREVLQLIAEGCTSKQIAERLGISEATVKTHRNHIMDKLDTRDTAGLTRHAIRLKLVRAE